MKKVFKTLRKKLFRTLVGQLSVLHVILFLIPALVIYGYLYNNLHATLEQNALNNLSQKYVEIQGNFESQHDRLNFICDTVSDNLPIKQLLTKGYLTNAEIVGHINQQMHPLFNLVLGSDEIIDEVVLFADNPDLVPISQIRRMSELTTKPWYDELETTIYGDHLLIITSTENAFSVSAYHAITDINYQKIIGAVEIKLSPELFLESILSARNDDIYSYAFINNGKNLFGSGYFENSTGVFECENAEDTFVTENDDLYYYNIGVEQLKSNVVVGIEKLTVFQNLFDMLTITAVIVFGATFILLILSYFITAKTLNKLNRVGKAVNEIGRGNFDVRLNMPADDEVGELALNIDVMAQKIQELIEQNYVVSLAEKEAKLKFLRNQINPHFLYNVLEVIKMKAEINDQAELSDSINALGTIMRELMSEQPFDMIPISYEIKNLKSYICLQELIFLKSVKFDIHLSEEIANKTDEYFIGRMLVQPLIENALEHGVLDNKCMQVDICFECKDDALIASVRNSGKIIPKDKLIEIQSELADPTVKKLTSSKNSGIGLRNVYQRIRFLYGTHEQFLIESNDDFGTTVSFRIPQKR